MSDTRDAFVDKRKRPIYIHSDVDDMTHLNTNDMRVYMHLARRANNDEGKAWPSYQTIGDHCFGADFKHPDTRRKAAIRSVVNLIKAGLLEKTPRRDPVRGDMTNIYALLDPPPVIYRSPPQGSIDHPPSDPGVTPPVIYGSPKDTPIEDTPIEEGAADAARGDGAAPAAPTPASPSESGGKPKAAKKTKPKDAEPSLASDPRIAAHRELCERFMSKPQMKLLLEKDPPLDNWLRAMRKWIGKGYNPYDIDSMLEWALDPEKMDRKPSPASGKSKNSIHVSPDEIIKDDPEDVEYLKRWAEEVRSGKRE